MLSRVRHALTRLQDHLESKSLPEGDDTPEFVRIKIWDQSALVLTHWLMTFDESSVTFDHPGQKQALRDLLTALEWDGGRYTGLNYTLEDVDAAHERVARDMTDDDRAT